LREAGIRVAGWGYCHQGANWRQQGLELAVEECNHHKLDAFVADVEPNRELKEKGAQEKTKSRWKQDQLDGYIDGLTKKFGMDNVGISTWPVLKIQDSPSPSLSLMRGVAGKVAMFAPQAYWMIYPKEIHYEKTKFSDKKYPPNDPESFVRLVADAWRAEGFTNPLVVTGQAYWGDGPNDPPKSVIEPKVGIFASTFQEWGKIAGFNWWHAGGSKAMSPAMVKAVIAGNLGQKPFAP
jgi:hypothetical protein